MPKDQRKTKTLLRLIRFGIILSLSLFIALALYSWTKSIGSDKQRKELAVLLKQTVEQEGVEAILSLSGVAVENIFHGDEGLILFEGSDTPWRYSADELQNISVYEKVNKSVVNITTNTLRSASDFLDVLPGQGTGSGIVLSSDGHILTNAHVVEGAETITVGLYNNQTYQAALLGVDSEDDLAVVKIDVGKDLVLYPIVLGSSSGCSSGEGDYVGNPFGMTDDDRQGRQRSQPSRPDKRGPGSDERFRRMLRSTRATEDPSELSGSGRNQQFDLLHVGEQPE